MASGLSNLETYQRVDEIMRIFRLAVRDAQEESRRLGVANVYSFNGQIYYELPDGELTRERPNSNGNKPE